MKQERRFMKKIFYATMLMTVCGLCARADEATLNRNASLGNSMNDYVGKFGVGVLIGEPMAASVKYWMNDSLALDGAAGWSFRSSAMRIYPMCAARCSLSRRICSAREFSHWHSHDNFM